MRKNKFTVLEKDIKFLENLLKFLCGESEEFEIAES
jgi:hypothetical protein